MNMPAVGRALVTIHRKYRQSIEQAGLLAARLGEDRQSDVPALPSTPFEEVRDFFYLRHNYIAELDEAAEAIAQAMDFPIGRMDTALAAYLADRHGVKLVLETIDELPSGNERKFDSRTNTLYLAPSLRPGQRAFQLGTQIAMLAFDRELTCSGRWRRIYQPGGARTCAHRARKLFRRRVDHAVWAFPGGGRDARL